MTQIAPTPVSQKRPKMLRSKKHIDWVRIRNCCACGAHTVHGVNDAAHVNYLGAKYGKPRGMSERVDDFWTVPLCRDCHTAQSAKGQSGHYEEAWWKNVGVDPEPICLRLARNSPDPAVREAVKEFENA